MDVRVRRWTIIQTNPDSHFSDQHYADVLKWIVDFHKDILVGRQEYYDPREPFLENTIFSIEFPSEEVLLQFTLKWPYQERLSRTPPATNRLGFVEL